MTATVRTTEISVECAPSTVPVNAPTSCAATVTDTSVGTKITPGGNVDWSGEAGIFSSAQCSLFGAEGSATCAVSHTASPGTVRSHAVTATYAGDDDHAGSTDDFELTVTKRTTTLALECDPSTLPVNSSTTCEATVSDSDVGTATPPTGTVTWEGTAGAFAPTSCELASEVCGVSYTPALGSAGLHTVSATYVGDGEHFGSSGTGDVTATKRSTSTEVNCSPDSFPVNSSTICTATVSDDDTGTQTIPTGTVDWSVVAGAGGFDDLSCTLNDGSCAVTYTADLGSVGIHTISATYLGDVDHFDSAGANDVTVTTRDTSTTLVCPSIAGVGTAVPCSAVVTDIDSAGIAVSPTGTVTWTSSDAGTLSSSSCTLVPGSPRVSSCVVSYTAGSVATHTVTATYEGSPNHDGSFDSAMLGAVGITILRPLWANTSANPALFKKGQTVPVKVQVQTPWPNVAPCDYPFNCDLELKLLVQKFSSSCSTESGESISAESSGSANELDQFRLTDFSGNGTNDGQIYNLTTKGNFFVPNSCFGLNIGVNGSILARVYIQPR